MRRLAVPIVLSALLFLALSFVAPPFSADEPPAARPSPLDESKSPISVESKTESEGMPDWVDLERDSRVPAAEIQRCEDVPFGTPCSECPPTCLLNGDEVPCECVTFRFNSRCFCPA